MFGTLVLIGWIVGMGWIVYEVINAPTIDE